MAPTEQTTLLSSSTQRPLAQRRRWTILFLVRPTPGTPHAIPFLAYGRSLSHLDLRL